MIPVNSSNLQAVGYNSELKELTIQFHSSGIYTYMEVPQHIYEGLMAAPSKGSYHHEHVKGYPYRKGF